MSLLKDGKVSSHSSQVADGVNMVNENSISEDCLRDQSNGLIEDDEYARTSSEVYKEVQGGGGGRGVM